MRWPAVRALVVAAVASPGLALAQGNPANPTDFLRNPHPTMPWSGVPGATNVDTGQPVRYVVVPPQPVVIEQIVPTPAGVPTQTQQQVVEIPGYQVLETTTGFFYPERWTLDRLNVGVYQWRKLPAEFKPR